MRRVDQLLSSLGYCSRKEAQGLCDEGRVRVGEQRLDDASRRVEPSLVLLDDEPLEFPDGLLVLLHKPAGVVCSHDSREGERIYDLLPARWMDRDPKVTSIGRLDKETSGLLVITDQGALVQKLTSPRHHIEKTYVATLDADPSPAVVQAFAEGVPLKEEGGELIKTLPATLTLLGNKRAEVTLHEGKYHQVRRMFAAHGLHVEALVRTRFGEWTLAELSVGEWRATQLSSSSKGSGAATPGA
jgi:16S rRNA pseudouridine516 synthase